VYSTQHRSKTPITFPDRTATEPESADQGEAGLSNIGTFAKNVCIIHLQYIHSPNLVSFENYYY